MKQQLYVEKLAAEGCMGFTSNIRMMQKNAHLLKIALPDPSALHPTVIMAGRFICTFMRDMHGILAMTFFDFMQHREWAEDTARVIEQDDARKEFLHAFDIISSSYDIVYDDFELVVDENFIPNLCYN